MTCGKSQLEPRSSTEGRSRSLPLLESFRLPQVPTRSWSDTLPPSRSTRAATSCRFKEAGCNSGAGVCIDSLPIVGCSRTLGCSVPGSEGKYRMWARPPNFLCAQYAARRDPRCPLMPAFGRLHPAPGVRTHLPMVPRAQVLEDVEHPPLQNLLLRLDIAPQAPEHPPLRFPAALGGPGAAEKKAKKNRAMEISAGEVWRPRIGTEVVWVICRDVHAPGATGKRMQLLGMYDRCHRPPGSVHTQQVETGSRPVLSDGQKLPRSTPLQMQSELLDAPSPASNRNNCGIPCQMECSATGTHMRADRFLWASRSSSTPTTSPLMRSLQSRRRCGCTQAAVSKPIDKRTDDRTGRIDSGMVGGREQRPKRAHAASFAWRCVELTRNRPLGQCRRSACRPASARSWEIGAGSQPRSCCRDIKSNGRARQAVRANGQK